MPENKQMICDFHTHTFFSDGVNSPVELVRCAIAAGYRCIALTDHASYCNMDELIKSTTRDCELIAKYWDIIAIPGVELTNVPAKSIKEMARYAKEKGARIVTVHGETIAENVEPGTNREAVESRDIDLLAHPGLLTIETAKIAAENDIYIEITHRAGHCLTNGIIANVCRKSNAKLLINSDAHSHKDLYSTGRQKLIALASGLSEEEAENILQSNTVGFLSKLGYKV